MEARSISRSGQVPSAQRGCLPRPPYREMKDIAGSRGAESGGHTAGNEALIGNGLVPIFILLSQWHLLRTDVGEAAMGSDEDEACSNVTV